MRIGKVWAWLAGLAVFCLLLYLLRSVLVPFVAGMGVAYLLDPVADKLEEKGCSRTLAVVIINVVFFFVLCVLMVLLIPLLQAQVVGFVSRVPGYFEVLRGIIEPILERLAAVIPEEQLDQLRASVGSFVGNMLQWAGEVFKGIWRGGMAVVNLLSLVVIMPLVAFYLLRDWDRIVDHIDGMLPRTVAPVVRGLATEIDSTLSNFVRGQALVCLLLGGFYAIGLTLVGLDFGLVVGLGTGIISFIPYFGMAIGMAVGLGIALAQFSDWVPIALVAAVFGVGQILEGNFLTPRMVGDKVGLHPVWVIFAVMAGSALFGFTGMLLSIPAAASIGVLVRYAVSRYRDSEAYGSEEGGEGEPS
ncbi:MAG: AI-2E family transporter [Rhodospirillales bacterium]|jgi:predicted PurR-regulated permease PerM|nr:AI-2E family transporter [Rhodospirillales bacterium]